MKAIWTGFVGEMVEVAVVKAATTSDFPKWADGCLSCGAVWSTRDELPFPEVDEVEVCPFCGQEIFYLGEEGVGFARQWEDGEEDEEQE